MAALMELQYPPAVCGELCRFWGIDTNDIYKLARRIIRKQPIYTVNSVIDVLESPYVEQRLLALLLLQDTFRQASGSARNKVGPPELQVKAAEVRERIVDEVVRRIPTHVNTVELVDAVAPSILGAYVAEDKARAPLLYQLADSESIWNRRSAVVATQALVLKGDFRDAEAISVMLFNDWSMNVRTGVCWLLRQAGGRDAEWLRAYLEKYGTQMCDHTYTFVAPKLGIPIMEEISKIVRKPGFTPPGLKKHVPSSAQVKTTATE